MPAEPKACNIGGLTNEKCPAGMGCTGRQSYVYQGIRYTQLVCEPSQPIDRLVFDLPAQMPPQQGVDVVLKFTMNGREWPVSTAGSAGKLTLIPMQAGESVLVDVPTSREGELRLKLPVGRYSAYVAFSSATTPDIANFPPEMLSGTLEVAAAGTATLNVDVKKLNFSVAIDSAPVGALAADEVMMVVIKGTRGNFRYLQLSGMKGEKLQGTLALAPDMYTGELNVFASKRFPTGVATLGPTVTIASRDSETVQLSTQTFPITGRILVDGADLPLGASGSVKVGAQNFTIAAARPASYSGRLFPGKHDISMTLYGLPMLTYLAVPLTPAFDAGAPRFDITIATAPFSAEVRLNGAQLPNSTASRGSLMIGGVTFDLGMTGPAVVNGRLAQLAQDVQISGPQGGSLPPSVWTLMKGFRPSSTRAVFDVKASQVRIDASYNRQVPPAGGKRGSFTLQRVDDVLPLSLVAASSGALSASANVLQGSYRVSFTTETTYTGLPQGQVALGELVVGAAPVTRSFEMTGTDVVVELRRQGSPLAAVAGGDRGLVMGTSSTIVADTIVAYASATARIPATGPSEVRLKLFSGVWNLLLSCDQMCASPRKDGLFLLAAGRLP